MERGTHRAGRNAWPQRHDATWRCGQNEGGGCGSDPAAKLAGGYVSIRSIELSMAWGLLLGGELRPFDVRVWLAVYEMRARRRPTSNQDRAPRYGLEELRRLVGGGGETLKASLRRLGASGLVRWSEGGPEVATSPEELVTASLEHVWAIYRAFPAKRSRIPVPRRVLRLLAGGVKRGVLATALGQLVWCLYWSPTKGWNPVGACKASWIADTFGLSERSVIRARQHLEELGWLLRKESPGQWHLNRYGARYEVNLSWSRSMPETLSPEFSTTGMSPPAAPFGTRLSPPDSHQNPLTERNKQPNPAPAGGGPRPGFSSSGDRTQAPNIRDIQRQDLASIPRLMKLFDQARGIGLVEDGFLERLNFAALAEHCRVRGTDNPPGMFARLLRWPKAPDGSTRTPSPAWHFVTEGDEEAVRLKLKAFLYEEPELLQARPGGGGEDESWEPVGCCF